MPSYLPFVLFGVVAAALLVWSIARHRQTRKVTNDALDRLGFRPCPDQKNWLEETIARVENNHGYTYEVRDPKRLPGEPAMYYYIKTRYRFPHDDRVAEEEILFPLKRRSAAGLLLAVKPSSIAPGLATRMLGALAASPWDAQPDDLQRLDLPPDLQDTNILSALGPPGASVRELVDDRTLRVVQGFGDAGGMFVQFRDDWCAVSTTSSEVPFKVDDVVSRVRPLLKRT